MLRGLAESARVIAMDQRGMGLSDRLQGHPDLETRMDDVRAVIEAAGSRLPTLWGLGVDGGALCAMFAATYPERVRGLILWPGSASGRRAPDYPWAETDHALRETELHIASGWGDEEGTKQVLIDLGLTSFVNDEAAVHRWAKTFRYAASRGDAISFNRMWDDLDFRSILPAIRVPTLVQSRNNPEEARWVTSQIPGASLEEFHDSPDYAPYVGDTAAVLASVRRFVSGLRSDEVEFDRVLATVLFTDIVDSTAQSAALGDRAWHELREQHDHVVRCEPEPVPRQGDQDDGRRFPRHLRRPRSGGPLRPWHRRRPGTVGPGDPRRPPHGRGGDRRRRRRGDRGRDRRTGSEPWPARPKSWSPRR